jgi:hypothetical protein
MPLTSAIHIVGIYLESHKAAKNGGSLLLPVLLAVRHGFEPCSGRFSLLPTFVSINTLIAHAVTVLFNGCKHIVGSRGKKILCKTCATEPAVQTLCKQKLAQYAVQTCARNLTALAGSTSVISLRLGCPVAGRVNRGRRETGRAAIES